MDDSIQRFNSCFALQRMPDHRGLEPTPGTSAPTLPESISTWFRGTTISWRCNGRPQGTRSAR